MREILFRGKAINRCIGYHRTNYKNGDWVYGLLTRLYDERFEFVPATMANTDGVSNIEIDYRTIGQYTGLKDKKGTKIFEGDIVVCKQAINGNFIDYNVEIGFVEMKYGAFGLHRKQGYYRPFKDWLENYEYEVIGNIHDNPELLEQEGKHYVKREF